MAETILALDQVEQGEAAARTPVLYPARDRMYGPATRSRLRRTGIVLACLWIAGFLPFLLDLPMGWRSFGLGLILPGAGFLYAGGIANLVLLGVTLLLFGLAFVLYFGSGNHIAPLAVWLGSAAGAAARTQAQVREWAPLAVAAALAIIMAYVVIRGRRQHARGRAFVATSNAKLEQVQLSSKATFGGDPLAVGEELSEEDLQFHRWILEMAFQPLDSFEGYTRIDQFQFAAFRYQISYLQYALAMAQYTRTPSFRGYVAEAQSRLIEKMTSPEVWRYWAYENFWGNFRFDPDPIIRDNIMMSGYIGLMVGMYESTNGDGRFNQPGSITFQWSPEKRYVYDNISISEAVARNFRESKFGMFPCEPNLLFPICNIIAVNGLKIYDRLHGLTGMDEILDRYRHATDVEFVGPDCRPVGLRVERLGIDLRLPFPMDGRSGAARLLGGESLKVLGPGPFSPLVAATLPDLVERELMMGNFARLSRAITSGKLKVTDLGAYDVGNYRNSGAGVHPWFSIAAREFGDEALFETIRQSADAHLEPMTENGVRSYKRLSVLSMAQLMMGRFSRKDGFYDLVNRGSSPEWLNGPILAEAPYPDVLVARAMSDGDDLSLVLRPGVASGVGNAKLGLAQLQPHRRYWSNQGHEILADERGNASIDIPLAGRVDLHIRPGD